MQAPIASVSTELRVYENEFHPLGGVTAEVFRLAVEWLQRAINGEPAETGRDVRHYVQATGARPTAPPAPPGGIPLHKSVRGACSPARTG